MNDLYHDLFKKLNHFYLITWIFTFFLLLRASDISYFPNNNIRAFIFLIMSKSSYALIYLLPSIIITKLSYYFINKKTYTNLKQKIIQCIAILSSGSTTLFIFINIELFLRYGFFVNGFVINLLITPKGLESLGCSKVAGFFFLLFGLSFFIIQWIFFLLINFLSDKFSKFNFPKRLYINLFILFIFFTLTERIIFAISHFQGYTSVLKLSNNIPFYKETTITKLAGSLGFNVRDNIKIGKTSGLLNYPITPLLVEAPKKPYNIVWLVAESWRADTLTPEIMPHTFEFAKEANHFLNNYSGGNGTRIAVFSMFTGLCGTYWPDFLGEQKSPVLFDILINQKYQIECFTSASFSYPEFNKTIFSKIPKNKLHEIEKEDRGWIKDRINVDKMLDFISKRDKNYPFMSFMFFESPHARYYFPEDCAIKKPYIKDLNYATMSLEKDMPKIKNSYLNAVYHLDTQFEKIINYLKNDNLLDMTIVIIVSDHGEEFMEFGKWGHNSNFTDPQTRTPLIIHIPGMMPKKWTNLTSHLDIPATILPILGVKNPPDDYSLGFNMFENNSRTSLYMGDFDHITYMDNDVKISLPIKSSAIWKSSITTIDDEPIPDKELQNIISKKQSSFIQMLKDMNKFRKLS